MQPDLMMKPAARKQRERFAAPDRIAETLDDIAYALEQIVIELRNRK